MNAYLKSNLINFAPSISHCLIVGWMVFFKFIWCFGKAYNNSAHRTLNNTQHCHGKNDGNDKSKATSFDRQDKKVSEERNIHLN